MMTEAAPRAEDVYNLPNEMEFKEWTHIMGRLTNNPDCWENFRFAIRRDDGLVLFMENFKSLLHSQVQQAAQESGLVSASDNRTRTLPRPAKYSAHLCARAHRCALSKTTPSRRTPRTHTPYAYPQLQLSLPLSTQGGSMDNIRNYLTPCGAPPWTF